MLEDEVYIEALNNDDYEAFDKLFRKYAERIYAFSLGITKQAFVAEEITQIVFIKIWEKRHQIDQHLSFRSFLFSVTYHEIISWLRKDKSEKKKVETFVKNKSYSTNETEIRIEFKNLENIASQVINSFPEKRRQIFILSREGGFSNQEIADELNISVKTVESHMTSALKTLRERLGKNMLLECLFFYLFIN